MYKSKHDIHRKKKVRRITARRIPAVLACAAVVLFFVMVNVISVPTDTELKGLEIKQNGKSLDVSWEADESKEYTVIVFGNKNLETLDVKGGSCTVDIDEIPNDYSVCVMEKTDADGDYSEYGFAELKTEIQEQVIDTGQEEYELIAGTKETIDAEAEGKLTYASSDEKVVKVTKKGLIKATGPGEAVITVTADEGDYYTAAEKEIKVTVYPDKLEAPVPEVSYEGASAHITWEAVPFAEKYTLKRFDPVTDEYVEIDEVNADECEYTVERELSDYILTASGTMAGEEVVSEDSEEIVIETPAEAVESYSSPHVLMTLDESNLEEVAEISGYGDAVVPQSFCYADGNYYVTYVSRSGGEGALVAFSPEGERVSEESVSMGDVNGSTYNTNTGKIYTVRTSSTGTSVDLSNGYDAETISLPRVTSGIAYNESTDEFYTSGGPKIMVTDSDFNRKEVIYKIRYWRAQDIGAAEGIAFVVVWGGGKDSAVDLYRMSDGEYIGSYEVPLGELESVTVVDKHLVLLMHNTMFNGVQSGHILRTKEPLDLL